MPTATSFSSWSPADKSTYTPISPFVNRSSQYKYSKLEVWKINATNSFSEPNTRRRPITAPATSTPATLTILLAPVRFYDDGCETSLHLAISGTLGAFSSALYATNRLIERSRSRTRERKMAMKSHRSSSNYYRYQQQALLQQQWAIIRFPIWLNRQSHPLSGHVTLRTFILESTLSVQSARLFIDYKFIHALFLSVFGKQNLKLFELRHGWFSRLQIHLSVHGPDPHSRVLDAAHQIIQASRTTHRIDHHLSIISREPTYPFSCKSQIS